MPFAYDTWGGSWGTSWGGSWGGGAPAGSTNEVQYLVPLQQATLDQTDSMLGMLDFNSIVHDQVYVRMLEAGLVLQHLPMWTDPEDKETLPDWAYIHDAEHRQIANLLGIQAPPDLSEFNFDDQAQLDAWLAYHLAHHVLISQALS